MGAKQTKISAYELKTSDMRPQEDFVVSLPVKEKPTTAENPGRHNRSNSNINLNKQPSNLTLSKQISTPVLTKMPSTRTSSEQNLLETKQKSTIKAVNLKAHHVKCSPEHSWLITSANLSNNSLADFEFGRVIGRGLMGTVRVTKTKKDNKYFVLKGVRKESVVKHNDFRHIQHERDLLYKLNNPFCIKIFGTFQDQTNIYFGLEYVPGGELFHHLHKKKSFPPAVAKFYATEVFSAIDHIQSLGYVYRDLKPENMLLDVDGHIKLIDFGFARKCEIGERMHTVCGTPAYLSPEQLDGKFTNGYTNIVDWWSYGILLFELLTGFTPFMKGSSDTHYEIFLRILKNKISFPFFFDPKSKDLIMQLCHAQLDKRLSSPEVIKVHPYYEIPWKDVEEKKLIPPIKPTFKGEGDDHYFRHYQDPGLPQTDLPAHAVSSKGQFSSF